MNTVNKIITRCSACQAKLAAPAERAGQTLTCPRCKGTMVVPSVSMPEEAPPPGASSATRQAPREAVSPRRGPPEVFEDKVVGFFSGVAKSLLGHTRDRIGRVGTDIKEQAARYKAMKAFRALLADALADGVLTDDELCRLGEHCQANGLELSEALAESQPLIEDFVHGVLADVISDGVVTDAEHETLDRYLRILKPKASLADEVRSTVARIRKIQCVREGQVEPIRDVGSLVLHSCEIPWLRAPARKVHRTKTKVDVAEGELYLTNQRVVFTSRVRPADVSLRRINMVEGAGARLWIVGKSKNANQELLVEDADLVEAYVDQALRKFHRQLDLAGTASGHRAIPAQVKQAVWARDQGRCVQCQATDYLEFDHIIPFCLGGSDSEQNVQLLCRRCNLDKSGRI